MKEDLNLTALLEIENDPSILEFRCDVTDIPLWVTIRIAFLRMIRSDLHHKSSPLIEKKGRWKYKYRLDTLIRTGWHNLFSAYHLEGNILISTSGSGLYNDQGVYKNRLSDHFADLVDDSLILEDINRWRLPSSREKSKVIYHDPFLAWNALRSRLSLHEISKDQSAQLVHWLRIRARDLFDWELGDKRAQYLVHRLNYSQKLIPIRYQAYRKFFNKRNIKVLIGKALCYGPGDIVLAAKDTGVIVAEYQHGVVSKGHDAYNIAPILIKNKAWKKILPDHFLAYGSWWNDQINTPLKKHIVGHPHRTEQIRKIHLTERNRETILVLGSGFETDTYLLFSMKLADKIGTKYLVLFRPHPRERFKFDEDRDFGIAIDDESDIYQSFQSAFAVISELSTGLFEAIGLTQRIFTWSTDKSRFSIPEHPFESFVNVDELVMMLRQESTVTIGQDEISKYWAPNWKENYLHFLREYGGIEC